MLRTQRMTRGALETMRLPYLAAVSPPAGMGPTQSFWQAVPVIMIEGWLAFLVRVTTILIRASNAGETGKRTGMEKIAR